MFSSGFQPLRPESCWDRQKHAKHGWDDMTSIGKAYKLTKEAISKT